jgi:hypothetical protein
MLKCVTGFHGARKKVVGDHTSNDRELINSEKTGDCGKEPVEFIENGQNSNKGEKIWLLKKKNLL